MYHRIVFHFKGSNYECVDRAVKKKNTLVIERAKLRSISDSNKKFYSKWNSGKLNQYEVQTKMIQEIKLLHFFQKFLYEHAVKMLLQFFNHTKESEDKTFEFTATEILGNLVWEPLPELKRITENLGLIEVESINIIISCSIQKSWNIPVYS